MKQSLLTRLRRNGFLFILGALLLCLGIPLYQSLILTPAGFTLALETTGSGRYTTYITWIGSHSILFISDHTFLLAAFLLLLPLPFSLYRIIVAQELLAQQENQENQNHREHEEELERDNIGEATPDDSTSSGMPEYAWRGKGFAVLAVWSGSIGLALYLLGTAISTIYLTSLGGIATTNATAFTTFFNTVTNTIGLGLFGLGVLFFGAMIARTGRNLWPGQWVIFGYAALFVGALLCISAVATTSSPGTGQNTVNTAATFLLAFWSLALGILLVPLKPEAAEPV